MSGAQASLAAAAVSNPMFQNAMKKSVFEAISGEETDNPDAIAAKDAETMNALEGVDAKELSQIKQWYYRLRVAMIGICVIMIYTSWSLMLYASTLSIAFIALYVFFFAIIICCYEIALKSAAVYIVQNFGFMYNPVGRNLFFVFVAILCINLGTFGYVCFALLIAEAIVQTYVYYRHPKFEKYMMKLHYYDKVKPGNRSLV